MRKTTLYFVAALGLAIAACGEKEQTKDTTPNVPVVRTDGLKIAFYNQDTLLKGFDFYQEMDSLLKIKQKRFEKELLSKEKNLQTFANDMSQRVNRGELSQNQIAMMQEEGQRKQDAYFKYQQTEGQKLEEEAMESLKVVSKKIKAAGKKYAEKHGLDILMADAESGSQFNFINPSMDVTKEFIEFINQEERKLNSQLGKKK